MSSLLHVCLYNTDSEASPELEDALRSLNFVRLVAETNSPEQLVTTLQDTGINIVFFHLDPRPGLVVEVIDQISAQFPDVALIAISHQTDPEAILAPMRAGCDQFVCEPIDLPDLTTAVQRVVSKRFQCQPKSRCICVTGAGGVVGATSISCNLALEIGNLADRDCALVDLDRMGFLRRRDRSRRSGAHLSLWTGAADFVRWWGHLSARRREDPPPAPT